MVSNVLEMEQAELARKLRTFKKKYDADPEYRELRAGLPKDWPL